MRKMLVALLALVALTIAVSTATAATNQITLGGTAADSLTFTGNGSGGWTLTFNTNPLTGTATGQGTLAPITGTYSLQDPSGVTITGTSAGTDKWTISTTGGTPLNFSIGSLLTGTLQLLNLSQSGSVGDFNYDLGANLTVTGGTDASLLGAPAAVLGITIDFDSATELSTLASGGTLGGNISSGELFPSPEPVSMVLVGSGLILLGGIARRRRTAR